MEATVLGLLKGNASHAEAFGDRFDDVQDTQRPEAVSVCCSDSRVLQDQIWDNDRPGRVFSVGNIGNRVAQQTTEGTVVSGDVLYPIAHTGTETAVVVGHTGCGAVTAMYHGMTEELAEPRGIEYCLELLRPHLEPGVAALPAGLDTAEAVNRLVEFNVDRQVQLLADSTDVPDSVTAVGVVYDFQDIYSDRRGEVHVVNVDGQREVGALRDAHPEVADRIDRLWEY